MFNRIVSLTMLALLASAPVSAFRKNCKQQFNGLRGTIEVTGSTAAGPIGSLSGEVLQGCGFKITNQTTDVTLCEAEANIFYGCGEPPDPITCPQPTELAPLPCVPCFGASFPGFQAPPLAFWQSAKEYLIRMRITFCKPFCKCQLPSVGLALQTRQSLSDDLTDCPLDVTGINTRVATVIYTEAGVLPAPYDVAGIALGRVQLHPLAIRAISPTELQISQVITIFAPTINLAGILTADDLFNGIFNPANPEVLRPKLHFQAEKECEFCCSTGSCA